MIKNCYHFHDKYFFFFCKAYCENFHLTKISPIFDGSINEIKKFVTNILDNRKSIDVINHNSLTDGVNLEEDLIRLNYQNSFDETIFFKPTTQKTMLGEFKSELIYFGGINPYHSTQDANYPLIINEQGIQKLLGLLIFFLVFK